MTQRSKVGFEPYRKGKICLKMSKCRPNDDNSAPVRTHFKAVGTVMVNQIAALKVAGENASV